MLLVLMLMLITGAMNDMVTAADAGIAVDAISDTTVVA